MSAARFVAVLTCFGVAIALWVLFVARVWTGVVRTADGSAVLALVALLVGVVLLLPTGRGGR